MSFADAATELIDIPIAPGFGVPIALKRAGVSSNVFITSSQLIKSIYSLTQFLD